MTSADDLKSIRKMMEESTRFLSLSGFSGVFLGVYAIAGALVARYLILRSGDIPLMEYLDALTEEEASAVIWKSAADAMSVLVLSLATGFYFSYRNARRSGKSFWTPSSKRLFINLLIPLAAGGLFTLALLAGSYFQLVVPVLLIFYGLALINAGKFTYSEIFYLGILEIITGLLAAFLPSLGLVFWSLGFGVLHIVYGLYIYRKYEA